MTEPSARNRRGTWRYPFRCEACDGYASRLYTVFFQGLELSICFHCVPKYDDEDDDE
jgi:hypothetical protein